jgi:hypothetical protein
VRLPWLVSRLDGVRWTLWLAVAVWFLWPWVQNPYQIGTAHDAAYFHHHAIAAWRSWSQYGQLPAWNPWFCGGIPGLGNLQESSVSPSVLLPIALGLHAGTSLALVLWFAVGMEGAWRYARRWGATRLSAVVAAVVFALSGRFATLFFDGQPAFVGFQLTPWVLLGFEAGMASAWAAVGGGVAMALVFLEGGAVATPLLGVLMLWLVPLHVIGRLLPWPRWRRAEPLSWDWRWRTAWQPLRALAVIGAVAVGLSALRLGAVVESLVRWPRQWHGESRYDWTQVWEMLTAARTDGGYDGPGTAYVGAVVFAVGAWALVRQPRRGWALASMLGLAVALAMGEQHPWAPWSLTIRLPVLHNLRCSFRTLFFAALWVGVLAAVALGTLQRDLHAALRWLLTRGRHAAPLAAWRVVVPWLLAGGVVALAVPVVLRPPALFNRDRSRIGGFEPAPRWATQPFRQSLGNRWEAAIWPAVGLGSLACFEEQPFATSAALRADLAAEEYLVEAHAGAVQRLQWTPHRISLAVNLRQPATLRINQNFHRAWRASRGTVVNDQGLLAVRLPAGNYAVHVVHRDPLVWGGAVVSLATALALCVVGWRRRAARTAAGAGSGGPPPGLLAEAVRGDRVSSTATANSQPS